jgi:hypothetical protein
LTPALPSSFEALFHEQKLAQFYLVTKPAADAAPAYIPPALPCSFALAHTKVHVTSTQEIKSSTVKVKSPFNAVARHVCTDGTVRLKTDTGVWVTEFTPKRNITVHVLPSQASGGGGSSGGGGGAAASAAADLVARLDEPRLQRWVGVQYHPQTELQSHYGEMRMARYGARFLMDSRMLLDPIIAGLKCISWVHVLTGVTINHAATLKVLRCGCLCGQNTRIAPHRRNYRTEQ